MGQQQSAPLGDGIASYLISWCVGLVVYVYIVNYIARYIKYIGEYSLIQWGRWVYLEGSLSICPQLVSATLNKLHTQLLCGDHSYTTQFYDSTCHAHMNPVMTEVAILLLVYNL